jgi:hypothetical protein
MACYSPVAFMAALPIVRYGLYRAELETLCHEWPPNVKHFVKKFYLLCFQRDASGRTKGEFVFSSPLCQI